MVWTLIRWALRLLPLALIALLLLFYLPGHDIVRIVGTDVNRMDRVAKSTDSGGGTPTTVTRDVRFINAVWPNGKPSVYRNEDTNWGFPWYFKFDSGNLQAQAQDLVSTKADPLWVEITHYGWRIELFSMFPNVVDIDPVESADASVTPWFNIIFLTLLASAWLALWLAWRRFLERLALDERFENASRNSGQVWRWLKATGRDLRRKLLG